MSLSWYLSNVFLMLDQAHGIGGEVKCCFITSYQGSVHACSVVSRVSNSFATPWTVACQVLLSMGFCRQENWDGLPFLSPEDLPDPGIEPTSPALADRFFTTETSRKLHIKGLCVCYSLRHVRLFAIPWTVAYQASLYVGFSRQDYQSGLPFPSPEDLPNPGIEFWSSALQVDSLPFELQGSPHIKGT